MPDGKRTFEYILEMPAGNTTTFRHVTLDWNPSGHEPEGVSETNGDGVGARRARDGLPPARAPAGHPVPDPGVPTIANTAPCSTIRMTHPMTQTPTARQVLV